MSSTTTTTTTTTTTSRLKDYLCSCLQDDGCQKRFVLVVVPLTLFLVSVLNGSSMTIVTKFLLARGVVAVPVRVQLVPVSGPLASYFQRELDGQVVRTHNGVALNTSTLVERTVFKYDSTDFSFGFLHAAKSLFQVVSCPKSGALVEKRGTDVTLMLGLGFLFASGVTFAYGENYFLSLLGRALLGLGSSLAETAALALVADVLRERRGRLLGYGLGVLALAMGIIYSSRLGEYMYSHVGKTEPFLLLASLFLSVGLGVIIVRPVKSRLLHSDMLSVPIWFLLMDPQVILAAGALLISRLPPAFLEQTIGTVPTLVATWGQSAAFVGSVALAVLATYRLVAAYPQHQWLLLVLGLLLEGVCTFLVPLAQCCWMLVAAVCGICVGVTLVDMVLLPTMAAIVDCRYLSAYGRVFALVTMCHNVAFALAPLTSKRLVQMTGFSPLMYIIGVCTVLYSPFLVSLRSLYVAESDVADANENQPLHTLAEHTVLMDDPPPPRYLSCTVQETCVLQTRLP